jgi:hypothetical protein
MNQPRLKRMLIAEGRSVHLCDSLYFPLVVPRNFAGDAFILKK